MRILVLEHVAEGGPGQFLSFLAEDGHAVTRVRLDLGETPPALDGFDALWVMGGPMDVWQEDEHPWLVAEKALIREAVEARGMPYFGICLGHQLLASALGGEVGPGTREIGVFEVQQTEQGAESIFLDAVPVLAPAFQWHAAEVKRLPEGARVLATGPACAVQAMSWGPRALGLQFHAEVEADTVARWTAMDGAEDLLREACGGAHLLAEAVDARLAELNAVAERVYINWLQSAAQPMPARD